MKNKKRKEATHPIFVYVVGVTSEGTTRQLGDFAGKFMEYDTSLVTRGGSNFMRIRVMLDVGLSLKRKKRISMGQNKFTYATFQLGHGESYCDVRLTLRDQQVEFGWDLSLRAMPRRGGQVASRWLKKSQEWVNGMIWKLMGTKRLGDLGWRLRIS
ncbi:hypothetical protein J1N35_006415 [Gossypium stocksii]|uniref:Uncharacterized protein n=1 Tax=Gossypium stocksii TaxID=47602 RepID=A0A9D3WHL1_9ROSI|nr:hypothetical protein J1N35_006415 [Gossypium stocksii]